MLKSNIKTARFNTTKVSQKYTKDPTKPSAINVKCKVCGLPNKNYQPLWCITSGKYISKRKKCTDEKCTGCLTIPQDPRLGYVSYCGSKAPRGLSAQQPSELTHTQQADALMFLDGPVSNVSLQSPSLTLSMQLPKASTPHSSGPLAVLSDSPAIQEPISRKGYNSREFRQFEQKGEKGPFKYWHGRTPVMNKMGRVRIWVLCNELSATMKIQRIDFSTYGLFLLKPGLRILDFNDRGISLVSPEGKELWHSSLDQLRLRKNGNILVEYYRKELEFQRK